jgi:hypothetical protein
MKTTYFRYLARALLRLVMSAAALLCRLGLLGNRHRLMHKENNLEVANALSERLDEHVEDDPGPDTSPC